MYFKCRVCGSSHLSESYLVPEIMYRVQHEAIYGECRACGSLSRTSELPDVDLYPENYYSITADPREQLGSNLKQRIIKVLAQSTCGRYAIIVKVSRYVFPIKQLRTLCQMLIATHHAIKVNQAQNILDVGTGSGYLPYVLSKSGKRVVGIDPYSPSQWKAGSCEIRRVSVNEIDEKFDLIMFHHSLEHMDDPKAELNTARTLLEDSGIVIIRIPKVDSEAWKIYATYWFQIDAPRHCFIPSTLGIQELVRSIGLQVIKSYDDSTTTQFWLSDQVSQNLSLMDPKSDYLEFRKPKLSPVSYCRQIFKTASLNKKNRGDQITLILQKSTN